MERLSTRHAPRHATPVPSDVVAWRRSRSALVALVAGAAVVGGGLTGSVAAQADEAPSIVAKTVRSTESRSTSLAANPITASSPVELLMLVASDGPGSGSQHMTSVSGCGLSWSAVGRANRQAGAAEIWSASAPHGVKDCAPTAALARSGYQGTVALMAVRNGHVADVRSDSRASGAASVVLPMRARSLALGIGHDWDRAASRTLLDGQRLLHETKTSLQDTMWVQQVGVQRKHRHVRVGTSSPRDDRWNFVAVSIAPGPRPHGEARPTTPPPATSSPSTTETPMPTSTPSPTRTPSSTPTPTPTRTPSSTPTPTLTPTPTTQAPTTPPPPPSSGGKPGPSNTGVPAGTTLTSTGGMTITKDNMVVDAKDISGAVYVRAKNVTITRSKIHGRGTFGVITVGSGSVTIEDSEIYGFENGIGYDNWTATRVDIHGLTDDGVKLGDNATLQDSWIHDMTPSADAHADGGQMQGGSRNVVVRHNVIDMANGREFGNAALFIAPDLGPSSDGPVTITGNWLNGGNYTVFCVDGNNGQYFVKNITFTNNRFGRQSNYGPSRVNVPITQSGNVWDDTGAALRL